MRLRKPQSYGKQFIIPYRLKAAKAQPFVEKPIDKKPEQSVVDEDPGLVSFVLPELEVKSGVRRKTFREKQITRLEQKTERAFLRADVPLGMPMKSWIWGELDGLPAYILPFLDVGRKTVYVPIGTKRVCVGTRTISHGVRGGIDLKEDIYEDRTTYDKRKELALKMRFSRTLKLSAAITAIWTVSYLAGCPPPQRFFNQSFQEDMKNCSGQPLDPGSALPDWIQSPIRQIICAESRYRHSNE